MNNILRPAALALLVLTGAVLGGCSSSPKKDADEKLLEGRNAEQLKEAAEKLYRDATKSLDSGDYKSAEQQFDRIARLFPFTEFGTQAELGKLYAMYRGGDPDKASSAADKFLREHPRNPHVDYVQYLKGLINFDRHGGLVDYFPNGSVRMDVSYDRMAFDEFALLTQRYPNSQYVADARQRMIYLRDRIAEHELWIVDFYMRRGAWIAAAKRAEQIIAQYPGAPATYDALNMMREAYSRAGLTELAAEARRVQKAQTFAYKASGPTHEGLWDWISSLWHHQDEDDDGATAPPPPIGTDPAPTTPDSSPATPAPAS